MPKEPAGTESGLDENNNRLFQLKDLFHFMFQINPTTGETAIRTTTLSGSAAANQITEYDPVIIKSTTPGTPVQLSVASEFFTRLIVQALPANNDDIAVANSLVNAASGLGRTLIAYGTEEYHNGNLIDLYIDVIQSGDGVSLTILK